MNEDLSILWQSQQTVGVTMAVEEIRTRAQRLKTRLIRQRRIGLTVMVLIVAIAGANLLFFGYPVTGWLRAVQYVLYVVAFILMPQIFRRNAAASEGNVLTLNMLAVSTPCVDFYRKELEGRRDDLRTSRVVVPVMIVISTLFALLGPRHPRNATPIVLAGLTATLIALVWYLRIRRETPLVQSELADLDAVSPKKDQPNGNRK
jgi:type IV secretory pathway VirB2 component (pilin)